MDVSAAADVAEYRGHSGPVPAISVFEHTATGIERIVFAPPAGTAMDMMLDLAEGWGGRYRLTYVLIQTPDESFEPGRYDYHGTLDLTALRGFFNRHAAFIASDVSHALWLASCEGQSLLIYDRHGLITAFGEVTGLRQRLEEQGCRPGFLDLRLMPPRSGAAGNAGELARLMTGWKWLRKPLNAHDAA